MHRSGLIFACLTDIGRMLSGMGDWEIKNGAQNFRHTIFDRQRGEKTNTMFVLDLPQTESTLHELEGRCHVNLLWILDGLVHVLSVCSRKGREVTPYSTFILDRFTCQYFIHAFGVNIR